MTDKEMANKSNKSKMQIKDYALSSPITPLQKLTQRPLKIENPFSALADFPPLTYSQTTQIGSSTQLPQIGSSIHTTQSESSTRTPISPQIAHSKSTYITKEEKMHIQVSPYNQPVQLSELKQYVSKLFPTEHFFQPEPSKTRTFYELILLDTKSIELNHNKIDSKNPERITYSTLKIKQVLTIQNLHQLQNTDPMPFSVPFNPLTYNYIDYQNAWFNIFFISPYDHSWFICFCDKCPRRFPSWFMEWWHFLGPTPFYYPDSLNHSLMYYKKNSIHSNIEPLISINFHADFKIPWILTWCYQIEPCLLLPNSFYSLVRNFKIKWWDKFNSSTCTITKVQQFLLSNNRHVTNKSPILESPPPTLKMKDQSPTRSESSSKKSCRHKSSKESKTKNIQALLAQVAQQLQDKCSTSSSDNDEPMGPVPEYFQDSQDPFDM